MPENILDWGISVILALQGLGDWLIGPMNIFTFTGNPEFFLLILPAIYWCWDARLGVRVAIILLVGLGVNFLLKVSIHDPRPYWLDPRVRLLTRPESTFGIPSGHSQNAAAIWGTLAIYLRTGWAWSAAVLLIFLIGLSRMYLGVHFPTDVLAGWALGLITLLLVLYLERPLLVQFNKLDGAVQVVITLAIAVGSILAGGLIVDSVSSSWQIPAEWIQNAALQAPEHPIDPFSMNDLIVSAGAFFGFTAGVILLRRRLTFDAGGPWGRRAGRYLVGAAGVFILWQGSDGLIDLVAVDDTLLSYPLHFIGYGLIGAWMSALAPLLFVRLGLAAPKRLQVAGEHV
jgi:membrane-associated phospholipid phosphatase